MALTTNHKFKIILIGEQGVGKTYMTRVYTDTTSNSNHSVVNLTSKELTVRGKKVKLCIWETSNKKWFKNVAPNYYDGVLLVYDTTNMTTFDTLSDWLTQLREKNDGAVAIVVGNKIDHPDSIAVPRDIAQRLTRTEDLEFMESSVKHGDSVTKIFEHLTLKILQAKNLIPDEDTNCESLTPLALITPDQSDEHVIAQQPDTSPILNADGQQTDETTEPDQQLDQEREKQNPGQAKCSTNGGISISRAAAGDSDDEELELSFVWISFLPPVVKLPPDITPLRVGRRRTSADSVLSLMTESKQNNVCLCASGTVEH